MAFNVENTSGASLDIDDLGITLETGEITDLALRASTAIIVISANGGDLDTLINSGGITVKDPIDGTTDLPVSNALAVARSANQPSWRVGAGARIRDLNDADLTGVITGGSLEWTGTRFVTRPLVIRQIVKKNMTTVLSTTTTIDPTLTPTSTDGDAFDTLSINMNGDNDVRIQITIPFDTSNGDGLVTLVHRDTTVLAVLFEEEGGSLNMDFYDAPGPGSHTYGVRVGRAGSSATIYVNQRSTIANPFGGTLFRNNTNITLTEIGGDTHNPTNVTTAEGRLWYDFSDTSTMWQDLARTIPVTGPDQVVESIANKFDITGIGGVTEVGGPFAEKQTSNDIFFRDATSDPQGNNPHGDFTATGPTVNMLALIDGAAPNLMDDGVDTWTGFAVFPVTPSVLSTSVVRKTASSAATGTDHMLGAFGVDSESNEIGFVAGGATFERSPTKTLGANANEWIMLTIVHDSSTETILRWRINGVDDISNLSGTTSVGTRTFDRGIEFGTGGGTSDWIGRLGEFIVYKGQLSDDDIDSVESYLINKWILDL